MAGWLLLAIAGAKGLTCLAMTSPCSLPEWLRSQKKEAGQIREKGEGEGGPGLARGSEG